MNLNSKGQGEMTDVLMTVILSICVLAVAFKVPEIIDDMSSLLTLSSAERTALDLGGLITISGAAQDRITIYYENEDETISYDITIDDRMIDIKNIRVNGEISISSETTIAKGWAKIGYGDVSLSLEDVRNFIIEKDRDDDGIIADTYDLERNE